MGNVFGEAPNTAGEGARAPPESRCLSGYSFHGIALAKEVPPGLRPGCPLNTGANAATSRNAAHYFRIDRQICSIAVGVEGFYNRSKDSISCRPSLSLHLLF
jgi:hypothetical protein